MDTNTGFGMLACGAMAAVTFPVALVLARLCLGGVVRLITGGQGR